VVESASGEGARCEVMASAPHAARYFFALSRGIVSAGHVRRNEQQRRCDAMPMWLTCRGCTECSKHRVTHLGAHRI